MTERARGLRAAALAILLWSSLAPLARLTAALPPFEVLALIFAIGALTCAAWVAASRRPLRSLLQPPGAFALGAGALFLYHALYLVAFRRAPAVEVNLINYLWPPLIVVFAALVWRQPAGAGRWLGLVLAFAGACLAVTRGVPVLPRAEYLPGYAAALGAALTWSLYSVLNRRHAGLPSEPVAVNCAAVAAAAALVHLAAERFVAPSPAQWLALLAMGAGPTGAAFFLWDRGTKHGELALLGLLSNAAPLLSTIALLAIDPRAMHWSVFAGLALVVGGILIGSRRGPATPATQP